MHHVVSSQSNTSMFCSMGKFKTQTYTSTLNICKRCLHTHACMCTYPYAYAYTHTQPHTGMHARTHTHIYAWMFCPFGLCPLSQVVACWCMLLQCQSSELRFPSQTEAEGDGASCRLVSIPPTFPTVALYKQVLMAALNGICRFFLVNTCLV